jgi:hypothetical protein
MIYTIEWKDRLVQLNSYEDAITWCKKYAPELIDSLTNKITYQESPAKQSR